MDRGDVQEREMLVLRKASADLDTLIDTSQVGMVVFDARSGAPVSVNRKTKRIVDGLRNPDQSTEHLREVLTVCSADGREASLENLSPGPGAGCGGASCGARSVMSTATGLAQTGPALSEYGAREVGVSTLDRAHSSMLGGHWVRTSCAVPTAVIQGGVSEPGSPLLGGRRGSVTSEERWRPVNGPVPATGVEMQVGE